MIDEDEIEDKEINEEIAELMKGQGMGAEDAATTVDAPEELDTEEEKTEESTEEDDSSEA